MSISLAPQVRRRSRGPQPSRQTLNLDDLLAEQERWRAASRSPERTAALRRLYTTIRGVRDFRSVDLG